MSHWGSYSLIVLHCSSSEKNILFWLYPYLHPCCLILTSNPRSFTSWCMKAHAGLTWLPLVCMWNSSSVNLSMPPSEPWTVLRCAWVLLQARCICKVCQLCCPLGCWSKSNPTPWKPPDCSPVPSYPNSLHVVIHAPFLPERLTPVWTYVRMHLFNAAPA